MINYIKSELYRSIKNANLKIMFVIFTVLIVASVLVLNSMLNVDPTFRYGNTRFSLGNVYAQMTMLFSVIVIFSAIMNDGKGNNTTKQSISFGISRNNIYRWIYSTSYSWNFNIHNNVYFTNNIIIFIITT